mgnify:CR=1 FL=1
MCIRDRGCTDPDAENYNSDATVVASNVRFRWEYQPGSELFIVYDEQRETGLQSLPHLSNRTLIVKINRLFRF